MILPSSFLAIINTVGPDAFSLLMLIDAKGGCCLKSDISLPIGRDRFYTALRKLKSENIILVKQGNEKGFEKATIHLIKSNWAYPENPYTVVPTTEIPYTVNQETVVPTTENPYTPDIVFTDMYQPLSSAFCTPIEYNGIQKVPTTENPYTVPPYTENPETPDDININMYRPGSSMSCAPTVYNGLQKVVMPEDQTEKERKERKERSKEKKVKKEDLIFINTSFDLNKNNKDEIIEIKDKLDQNKIPQEQTIPESSYFALTEENTKIRVLKLTALKNVPDFQILPFRDLFIKHRAHQDNVNGNTHAGLFTFYNGAIDALYKTINKLAEYEYQNGRDRTMQALETAYEQFLLRAAETGSLNPQRCEQHFTPIISGVTALKSESIVTYYAANGTKKTAKLSSLEKLPGFFENKNHFLTLYAEYYTKWANLWHKTDNLKGNYETFVLIFLDKLAKEFIPKDTRQFYKLFRKFLPKYQSIPDMTPANLITPQFIDFAIKWIKSIT